MNRRKFSILLALALPLGTLFAQSRIDVLVVYTPAVENFFNGPTGVRAQLLATFAVSNEALENSDVDAVFNLLGPELVNYTEAGDLGDDLDRLQAPNDGFLDEVHALRDQYGADHVALMRRDGDGSLAGKASVLERDAGLPDFAFSVFSDVDGLSNFVFAHELGHNLGLAHAFDEDGEDGIRNFARGWRFNSTTASYRTIMATTTGFTRIPFYSNPNVTFDGEPTGNASAGDAARGLGIGLPIVEAYRAEQPAAPEFFAQPTDQTVVRGAPARLGSLVNGLPPLDLQWFKGVSGNTANPVNGASTNELETPALNEPETYWLRASNPDGTQESRTVRVHVVDEPAGPFEVIANVPDESAGQGFGIDKTRFQQVRFSGGYVDSIEVEFFTLGVAVDAAFSLVSSDGASVASGVVPAAGVSSSGATVTLPIRAFVDEGERYRLEVFPAEGTAPSGSDRLFWQGSATNGTDGLESSISSQQSNPPNWRFSVLARGRAAETFTIWQAEEGIAEAANNGFGDDANALGIPNGILYATGQSVASPDRGALPQVSVEGDEVVLRFRVLADAVDVEARAQQSADLIDFADTGLTPTPVASGDPDVEAFELRVPLSAIDPQDPDAFFRLIYSY